MDGRHSSEVSKGHERGVSDIKKQYLTNIPKGILHITHIKVIKKKHFHLQKK